MHWHIQISRLEIVEFFGKSAAEDGPAAPGFGVEVLIVEVEAGGIAFAFPLVAAPEGEEAAGPAEAVGGGVLWETGCQQADDFGGRLVIPDGGAFDEVEDVVGHEVIFVGLGGVLRAEFGTWGLLVDDAERGDGVACAVDFRAGGFQPTQPVAEECFVDAGDGGEAAGGVAVHGGVTDGGFAAVAGGEEEGVAEVGEHPDAGGADAGLDVLQGDVVAFPGERRSLGGSDKGEVSPVDVC